MSHPMQERTVAGLAAISISVAFTVSTARAAEPAGLDKAEVVKLVAGKTLRVEYVDPIDLELAADGKFKSLATASGIRGTGGWSVDEQGRLCLVSPSPLLNGCRTLQRGERGLGMTKPDGTGFFPISAIR